MAKHIDNGSDDHPVDEGADMNKNATSVDEADRAKDDEDGEGVHVQVYDERVQVDVPVQTPVNGEGGAIQNQVVGGMDVAKVDEEGAIDDNEVATSDHTVYGGRDTVRIQVDEGANVAKVDEGGEGAHVQVDDETELAKGCWYFSPRLRIPPTSLVPAILDPEFFPPYYFSPRLLFTPV